MNDPPLHYLGQSQDTLGAAEHPLKYLLGRASGNMDMRLLVSFIFEKAKQTVLTYLRR